MPPQASNPRLDRLSHEQKKLMDLQTDSDFVRVEPIGALAGRPPERYKVIFLCRGITGIDGSQNPIYGERHEVEIYCDEEFPSNVPRLRWNSPVWHPNIQHQEPKNVCVNKSEWMGSTGLDDLCQQMFEMVQYKNYHAQNVPPYPLDPDAAAWVRDYAEPRGIVDKRRGIFVDNRPFYKAKATSERALRVKIKPVATPSSAGMRVVITKDRAAAESSPGKQDPRTQDSGTSARCRSCGGVTPSSADFCIHCGAKLRTSRVRITS